MLHLKVDKENVRVHEMIVMFLFSMKIDREGKWMNEDRDLLLFHSVREKKS